MSIKLCNENKPYYDVYYYDNENKRKHAKFSLEKYGKHAKLLAEYADKNGIRLKNWYEKRDDIIVIFTFNKSENKYYEILIDSEDYNKVKDYYWAAEECKQEHYAITKINKNTKIRMHRLIMNVTKSSDFIDHIKGNGLDNRKSNLRIVTLQENNKNRVHLQKNNNTGINGVTKQKDHRNGYYYYDVTWTDEKDKKTKHKRFSCNKYGDKEAFELATEYRKKMEDLNK